MNRISISVGRPHEVIYQERRGREKIATTRILKHPVEGRAMLRALNI